MEGKKSRIILMCCRLAQSNSIYFLTLSPTSLSHPSPQSSDPHPALYIPFDGGRGSRSPACRIRFSRDAVKIPNLMIPDVLIGSQAVILKTGLIFCGINVILVACWLP